MINILYIVFLAGLVVASFQDLKRREVDNWLNLFLLVFGWGFLVFQGIFNLDVQVLILGVVSFVAMFMIANLFYYSRVFAGGDAKLLFALFAVFVAGSFFETMVNIGWFVFFLLICGSVYGIFYSLLLFGRNFSGTRKEFARVFENVYLRYMIMFGVGFFILSYVDFIFLIPAVLFLGGGVLYGFAKSLEKVVMTRSLSVDELREGDWLVDDLKVGKKVIRADYEGLSLADIDFLKKSYKKKIKIKEGIPFVPGFLFAFVLWLGRGWALGLVGIGG